MEKKKILIVDDEEELVSAIKIRLELAGYEIQTANDGQQALDAVKFQRPDLIILDLMLPKIDGFKVCRMLKFDEKYKAIPIMMLTARAQESDEKLGKDVGADAYVMKPFEHVQVLSKIEELLKNKN